MSFLAVLVVVVPYYLWPAAALVALVAVTRLVARRAWRRAVMRPLASKLAACLPAGGLSVVLALPLLGYFVCHFGSKGTAFAVAGVPSLLWLVTCVVVPLWLLCTRSARQHGAPGDAAMLVQPPDNRLVLLVLTAWALLVFDVLVAIACALLAVDLAFNFGLPIVLWLGLSFYASVWLTVYALRQVNRLETLSADDQQPRPLPGSLRTALVLALAWMLLWPFPLFPLGSKIRNVFVTVNTSISSTW